MNDALQLKILYCGDTCRREAHNLSMQEYHLRRMEDPSYRRARAEVAKVRRSNFSGKQKDLKRTSDKRHREKLTAQEKAAQSAYKSDWYQTHKVAIETRRKDARLSRTDDERQADLDRHRDYYESRKIRMSGDPEAYVAQRNKANKYLQKWRTRAQQQLLATDVQKLREKIVE